MFFDNLIIVNKMAYTSHSNTNSYFYTAVGSISKPNRSLSSLVDAVEKGSLSRGIYYRTRYPLV